MVNSEAYGSAVLTCNQMGACDRWTVEQDFASGMELMENAGAAVADVIMRRFADASPIHVFCGPGNNGGDGYVVARMMKHRGADVRLYALAKPKPGTDASLAAQLWDGEVLTFEDFRCEGSNGLLIDAVFGAGFTGKLPEAVSDVFRRAQNYPMRKLAIDVPSGLYGDTGLFSFAMPFDATVTFFRKKPGHICGYGPEICGEITVADIGVRADFADEHRPAIFENSPALWRDQLQDRLRGTHKYRQGHVAVFSGPRFQTGASRLSAQAAARVGAGAVTLLGSEGALDVHANHVTSIMLKELETQDARQALASLNNVSAGVLGPGFGDFEEARELCVSCLQSNADTSLKTFVMDADAISSFAADPEQLFAATHANPETTVVLTPHEGEFDRLFPDLAADNTLGKLQKTLAAAKRAHSVIIYKGSDTVIASPDDELDGEALAAINTNGTTALATAGSGDVLAGIIAGLAAQGMKPFFAACAAVWMHGEAGRKSGPICIAEDLVDALRMVRNSLHREN